MPQQVSIIVIASAALALTVAFALQWSGYEPCRLCYMGRYIWWSIIALTPILISVNSRYKTTLLYLIAVGLCANVGLSFYHAGGEWQWWTLDSLCRSNTSLAFEDLFQSPILCHEAPLRILGLSPAAYNGLLSAALAAFIIYRLRKNP